MQEEELAMPRFAVCKRRNVAAAYERFLGPSAGALEESWQSRTWTGLMRILAWRKRRTALVPIGLALQGAARGEQQLLGEGTADQLQGDRQPA